MNHCIYCRKPLNGNHSTEHVLPRSLGTFEGDSPTLLTHVCIDCNNEFSKLERVVAQESWESIARVLSGAKAGKSRTQPHKNISIVLKEGVLKGAEYDPVTTHDITQIGLRLRNTDEYAYYSLPQFRQLKELDREKFDVVGENALIVVTSTDRTRSEAQQQEVLKELTRLGIKVNSTHASSVPKGEALKLQVKITVTTAASRVYSKIAFNYLAHITSPEYVLQSSFDNVREYIRTGNAPHGMIHARIRFREPDLNPDTAKETLGRHLLACGLTNLGSDVSGFVMLYNSVYFKIKLCRFYPNFSHHKAITKGSGLLFDINTRSTHKLGVPPEFHLLA